MEQLALESFNLGPIEEAHGGGGDSHRQDHGSQKRSFVLDRNHVVKSLLGERLAGEHRIGVGVSPFTAVELWFVGGRRASDFGQNQTLFYITMGIEGVQASGAVVASLGLVILAGIEKVVATTVSLIILAGEQKVIMGIRVRVDEELFSIGARLDEQTFHMNLILVLTRHWWECVSEGRDMVFNIIHVSEVKSGNLLPQHGVSPDDIGGAVGLIHLRIVGAGRYGWPNFVLCDSFFFFFLSVTQ